MENAIKKQARKHDVNDIMFSSVACEYLNGNDLIRILNLLHAHNMLDHFTLVNALEYSESDEVIDFILRYVHETNANTLKQAITGRKFKYFPSLLAMNIGDINDRDMKTGIYIEHPELWKPEYGKTALILAAEAENFDIVKMLVEYGADVNIRAEDGSTAASIAYDRGRIEIYNYLKANGAVDFEPRQVAQPTAPTRSSTTNVYVQPSAPAQSNNTPAAPQYSFDITKGGGIYGVYRSSAGGFVTINYGNITFTSSDNRISSGTCSISGNTLSVTYTSGPLLGTRLSYTISSNSQFSNRGEVYRK
jgi:hypothetical protein